MTGTGTRPSPESTMVTIRNLAELFDGMDLSHPLKNCTADVRDSLSAMQSILVGITCSIANDGSEAETSELARAIVPICKRMTKEREQVESAVSQPTTQPDDSKAVETTTAKKTDIDHLTKLRKAVDTAHCWLSRATATLGAADAQYNADDEFATARENLLLATKWVEDADRMLVTNLLSVEGWEEPASCDEVTEHTPAAGDVHGVRAVVGMRVRVLHGDDENYLGVITEVSRLGCWVQVEGLTDDDGADDGSIAFGWRNVAILPQQMAEVA